MLTKIKRESSTDTSRMINLPFLSEIHYILTLVDFATCYPEAVLLKNFDTETVAEALVDILSSLGVSEEILSDVGTQFVSECMEDVAQLLSIKQLTTTPLILCNGLTRYYLHIMKFLRSLLGFRCLSCCILQSSFGFISIITPLVFDVPWLKKALLPHSADQVSTVSLELWIS